MMLREDNIIQVIADPAVIGVKTNKDQLFQYFRLHGSPQVYSSSYSDSFLDKLKPQLNQSSYVIFDNTMLGAATQNAMDLKLKFLKSEANN